MNEIVPIAPPEQNRRIRVYTYLLLLALLGVIFADALGPVAFALSLLLMRLCVRARRYALGSLYLFCMFLSLLPCIHLSLNIFGLQAYRIESTSMSPTVNPGERIMVDADYYEDAPIEVGDIVVYRPPKAIYDPRKPIHIKRIAGLPGDLIQSASPDDPPDHPLEEMTGYVVEEGMCYVLGDHSASSYDSRYWGALPLKNLRGKVIYRWWPPDRMGPVK